MRTLNFNLKKEWYDLIEKGIKKEEYREITPYWLKRLINPFGGLQQFKEFDSVTFRYGYTKRNMTFKCEGISIGEGKPEWGAVEGQKYVVIKIGERIA